MDSMRLHNVIAKQANISRTHLNPYLALISRQEAVEKHTNSDSDGHSDSESSGFEQETPWELRPVAKMGHTGMVRARMAT